MGSNYYDRRKRFTDNQLVACYLKYESQIKAAEELGCSRETVARAVRRAGIKARGWRRNHKDGGSPRKITDAELIEEAKTMTRGEIAKKHKMCICNVDRKLKRLGIKCKKAEWTRRGNIGTSRHYHERAVAYSVEYDANVTLERVIKRDGGICQLCGKPVDTTSAGRARLYYPSIDHIIPLSKGGGHTWNNVQLAHMICNSRKGATCNA